MPSAFRLSAWKFFFDQLHLQSGELAHLYMCMVTHDLKAIDSACGICMTDVFSQECRNPKRTGSEQVWCRDSDTTVSWLHRAFTGPTLVRDWSIQQVSDSTINHRLRIQSMRLMRPTSIQTPACTWSMRRISQQMIASALHALLARILLNRVL